MTIREKFKELRDSQMSREQIVSERDQALLQRDQALEDLRQASQALADRGAEIAFLARQRDEARASLVYANPSDTEDEHSAAILAAHPIKSGNWKHWNTALEMVSNRHSKGPLVMLVNWLLVKSDHLTTVK